jgi:FkbM family methyltransferase
VSSLEPLLNPVLVAQLARWHRENLNGGWRVRWRRRPVWAAQVVQKLGFHRQVDAPMFFGERMRVVTGERVSRALLTFGYSECALSALMLRLIRRGDAVVDVGAHFGYEALLAAKLVGPAGRVYSFEPNPIALALAKHNLSRFSQVELFGVGVADRPGFLRLQTRPIEDSAFNSFAPEAVAGDSVEVAVTTIDIALAHRTARIRLLKCDAEGFELDVVRGAAEVVTRDRPILVLEADMRDQDNAVTSRSRVLAEFLAGFGYQPFDFEFDGRLQLGPIGSLVPGHANVAFVPAEEVVEFQGLADAVP